MQPVDHRPVRIDPTAPSRAEEWNIPMTRSSLLPHRRAAGRCRRAAWALAPALLLFPGAAHAAALDQYSVQELGQSGVHTDGFNPTGNDFEIGRMNNQGQISLVTKTQESKGRQVLGVLSNGRFTPIAAAGGPSPDGKTWPASMYFAGTTDINESGNVAFAPLDGSSNSLGVYFWDAAKQAITLLAVPGMPATGDLVFASGGRWHNGATLNNRDEVAFLAYVKPASGPASDGVFLRRADGRIDPVALPGDALPGQGGTVRAADVGGHTAVSGFLGLNDAGQVIFQALGTGIKPVPNGFSTNSVYRWDSGTISLLADSGTVIPGLGKTEGFYAHGPNNLNSEVLLNTWTLNGPGINGILLWQQGQLVPILLNGQELPGGGKFKGGSLDWGRPNELGLYPIVAQFQENGQIGSGAYLVGPDGKLSLIARTGMTTPLGTLTQITPAYWGSGSSGIGINQQGQVTLTAKIDHGPDVLLLLTPKSPAGSPAP
jgi:hypothetical protein